MDLQKVRIAVALVALAGLLFCVYLLVVGSGDWSDQIAEWVSVTSATLILLSMWRTYHAERRKSNLSSDDKQ